MLGTGLGSVHVPGWAARWIPEMPVGERAQAAPFGSYKSHKPRQAAQDYISQAAGPCPPPRAARHGSARRGGRWRRGPGEPGGGAMPKLSQVPRRRAGPRRGVRARPGSARDAGPGEAAGVAGGGGGARPGAAPLLRTGPGAGSWARGAPTRRALGSSPLWWSRLLVLVLSAGPRAGCGSRGWEYAPGMEWVLNCPGGMRCPYPGCSLSSLTLSGFWVLLPVLDAGCGEHPPGLHRVRVQEVALVRRAGPGPAVLSPGRMCWPQPRCSSRMLPGEDVLAPGRMLALAGVWGWG